MELTEVQKLLVACLKNCGVSLGKSMVVCLVLEETQQQLDMAEYLLNNGKVTDEEAIAQAYKIAKKQN